MTFDEFDQAEDGGWRVIARGGDCSGAAAAIAAYLQAKPDLEDWQKRVLYWHATQMHAFAGDTAEALRNLPLSMDADEPADTVLLFNAYAGATAAFLQGDREGLLAAREQLACGPQNEGSTRNLIIVDRLIANFGKPYSEAY